MQTLEVIKLNKDAKINQLKLGRYYYGVLQDNVIKLSDYISIPLKNIKFHEKKDAKFFAVLIKKIQFPDTIIAEAYLLNNNLKIKSLENKVRVNSDLTEYKKLNEINELDFGKCIIVRGVVDKIIKTSGRSLFRILDETGSFIIKSLNKTKVSCEIHENDTIEAKVKIVLFNGVIEGEILSMKKIKLDKNKIIEKYNHLLKPVRDNFSIPSEVYERMKKVFIDASYEIKRVIFENRPIILRHHADCDGFSGALALEESIFNIMNKFYESKTAWLNYSRFPNRTPFYEYFDASRDLAIFLDNITRFGSKEPLFIVIDFGSTKESLNAYRKLKLFNAKIIVIDHHISTIDELEEIKSVVDFLINPWYFGGDSGITAGMLAYELSLFVETHNFNHLPVISGFGDKSESKEFEEYTKFFNQDELNRLKQLSEVLDYEAFYLKTTEGRTYFRELLFNPEIQQKLIDLIYPEIDKLWKNYEKLILENLKIVKQKPLVVVLENITDNFNYPGTGKITGFAKKVIMEKFKREDVVVLYVMDDSIVIRCGNVNLSVRDKILEIKKKFSHYFVNGGGHETAGSIRFLKLCKERILEELLDHPYE